MLERNLRELAARESTGPFLSLYLDTRRGDVAQKDRIRVLLKNEKQKIRESLEGNGQDEALEKGIRQIESWIENDLQPATRGVAIFSCPSDQVFIPLELPVAVEPELSIGSRPHLRQLEAIRRRNPDVALAIVDGKFARLFQVQFGRVGGEIDLTNPDLPRRHDQGGWSQANMQRHVQDHIDRHHKEVAESLTRLVELGEFQHVIISGQERNLANFRSFLPARVEEKIIGALSFDIRSSEEELSEACRRVTEQFQNRDLQRRLVALSEAALSGGKGALGVAPVLDAANQRRLMSLFLSETFSHRGWRCKSCGTLGESIPVGCPACGEGVETVELADELISAAELEDATVDMVPAGHTVLEDSQGVGALLRY